MTVTVKVAVFWNMTPCGVVDIGKSKVHPRTGHEGPEGK